MFCVSDILMDIRMLAKSISSSTRHLRLRRHYHRCRLCDDDDEGDFYIVVECDEVTAC